MTTQNEPQHIRDARIRAQARRGDGSIEAGEHSAQSIRLRRLEAEVERLQAETPSALIAERDKAQHELAQALAKLSDTEGGAVDTIAELNSEITRLRSERDSFEKGESYERIQRRDACSREEVLHSRIQELLAQRTREQADYEANMRQTKAAYEASLTAQDELRKQAKAANEAAQRAIAAHGETLRTLDTWKEDNSRLRFLLEDSEKTAASRFEAMRRRSNRILSLKGLLLSARVSLREALATQAEQRERIAELTQAGAALRAALKDMSAELDACDEALIEAKAKQIRP